MTQAQEKILKMMYNDQLEYITCPKNAKYEECIEIAFKRFEIPPKFKESIQITNEFDKIFEKHTFEYYNMLFPSPAIIFYIQIDNEEFSGNPPTSGERVPFAKLSRNIRNNKRKYCNENHEAVPVSRQNCFLGSLIGLETEEPEEHINKKHKASASQSRNLGVVKRTTSSRSIRI